MNKNQNKSNFIKLEFDKIQNNLSQFAITETGKNLSLELLPSNNVTDVKKSQDETTEALVLLFRKGDIPIGEIKDITKYILLLEKNNFLSSSALLSIANVLKTSRLLKEYYFENPLNESDVLTNYFNNLYTNNRIETTIFSSIIDENTISDDASIELANIRRNMRKINQEIRNKLQSLLNSKYLQEPIITIKNNRFVVPVKNEYRSDVKGFVHDISTSGSTVFIEPMSVFELNNKLNSLKNEETIEIEKILQKLSSLFFDITNEIKNTFNLIGIIDFIFAKAKYSKEINGISPIISEEKKINLIDARHPLIDKDVVVPITLSLGEDYTTLVITGPNTGGKTVTLKTVGLLCLMGMSGLHIPAKEKSSIYVFDNIFADIGDEQSIQESLSTFSSHMVNVVNITRTATENSLVLLDELGSGTDPVEGANLAISILEFLANKNILTMSTTHYQEIKNYAMLNDKFENASCEFDINTLSPTYRLLIGVPGRSNAFEISKKLGLSSDILDRARSLLNDDTVHIEELLKNIYDNKLLIEKEKEKILKNSEDIEKIKTALQNEKDDISSKKTEIISKAKSKAKDIILEAKEDANEILKEMESSKDSKKLNKLRKDLNDKLENYTDKNENNTSNIENSLSKEDAIIGTEVFIPSLNQSGSIVSNVSTSNKVMVQIGSIKMSFDISKLVKKNNSNVNTNFNKNTNVNKIFTNYSNKTNFTPRDVSTEINVIGYNVEEAIFVIDKFLDNAAMSKLETVRIVHGKGTGVLGKGIQKFLKNHPHVKNYRYGTFGEGEMGVTVVELKK